MANNVNWHFLNNVSRETLFKKYKSKKYMCFKMYKNNFVFNLFFRFCILYFIDVLYITILFILNTI